MKTLRRPLTCLLFMGFLTLCWQLLSAAGLWETTLFPSPAEVLETLKLGVADGTIAAAVAASMKRLCIGYGIALAIGIPLGLLLGRNRLMDDTVGSVAVGLQALPSICWLPLAVLWFGLSETAMQFVIVMGSFMSLTLAIRDGVRNIPLLYIRAARVLGATGWQFYRYVLLPACLAAVTLDRCQAGVDLCLAVAHGGRAALRNNRCRFDIDDRPRSARHAAGGIGHADHYRHRPVF